MSCINPNTNAPYQIGEIGPSGGIIFSVPGHTHTPTVQPGVAPYQIGNNTNYYYEMGLEIDSAAMSMSTRTKLECGPDTVAPFPLFSQTTIQYKSFNTATLAYDGSYSIGSEFGGKDIPIGTSAIFGDGLDNTQAIAALPSFGNVQPGDPPNPVFDVNNIASVLAIANAQGGYNDWFIPSYEELIVMLSEVGGMTGLPSGMQLPISPGSISQQPISHQATPWYQNEYWSSSEANIANNFSHGMTVEWNGSFVQNQIAPKCHVRPVRVVRRFECNQTYFNSQIPHNWRFGKSNAPSPWYIPNNVYTNEMQMLGLFDVGGASVKNNKMIGEKLDVGYGPGIIYIGLNPLTTQGIPIRMVNPDYVHWHQWTGGAWPSPNSAPVNLGQLRWMSYYGGNQQLFNLATNNSDPDISPGVYAKTYHITIHDKYEKFIGKWKYEIDNFLCVSCGAWTSCARWVYAKLLTHLGGVEKYNPQEGDFLLIEGENTQTNDWSNWPGSPPNQDHYHIWDNMTTFGPVSGSVSTLAMFGMNIPDKPFTEAPDLDDYCGTGTSVRLTQSSGITGVPWWRACTTSCMGAPPLQPTTANTYTPQVLIAQGCREWKANIPPPIFHHHWPISQVGPPTLASPLYPFSHLSCCLDILPPPVYNPTPPPPGSSSKMAWVGGERTPVFGNFVLPDKKDDFKCIDPYDKDDYTSLNIKDYAEIGTAISVKTSYMEDDNQDVEVRISKDVQTKRDIE